MLFRSLIIKALKKRGVPVAGADRLELVGHIAVKDLMALGRALLLPEDDLTFACLLKSPLVGLDDDELFTLAHDRGARSLLEAVLWHGGEAQPQRDAVVGLSAADRAALLRFLESL